ncbi:hypothetical protein MASR1M31_06370 [Porphyromonadaceae bacterium]
MGLTQNNQSNSSFDRPTEESHVAGGTIHFSDGSKIFVNQIPNDGSPRAVDFPARTVTSIRFEVTDADGLNVGLSEIEVFPDVCDYKDYVEKVDPFIESARGRYIFFLTGQQPFGMISSAPLTRNKNQYGGGYNYNSKEILGFPQVHGWMNAGIVLMPTTGAVATEKGNKAGNLPFLTMERLLVPVIINCSSIDITFGLNKPPPTGLASIATPIATIPYC